MAPLSLIAGLFALTSMCSARKPTLAERGIPVDPTGVMTIKSSQGAEIRFKQPGKAGICETAEGVDDYSGYISLDEHTNMFFWFFEAREKPSEKPLTLWLNGGPGSDSMIGLFQELGPCNITEDLKSQWNPYAWNEESNMLFLSQPIGVGFSYETTRTNANGRYSLVNSTTTNTSHAAAVGAWHILQTFLDLSPQLDPDISNFTFNLWTESYGGHYGPAFYNYFYKQNELIRSGNVTGVELTMDTLGIINGLIDEDIQAPYYPEFATNNTYGIKAITDEAYTKAKVAYNTTNGCHERLVACKNTDRTSVAGQKICSGAISYCRSYVEYPYYNAGNAGVYDIRHPYSDPTPPEYFIDYLNLASTQEALGVNINYTSTNAGTVYTGFTNTGDWAYPDFLADLEEIIGWGVRVALVYGDADYICNWFGGEAVALATKWVGQEEFVRQEYSPFSVNGTEYGQVKEVDNFSFTRIYEAGHEVPYYQPEASLELFKRIIGKQPIAQGWY
ncbi:peptidase S10, serine carboxypeptidase [Pleomassaria siparia CBS 279.74]|uniref:Carboxypeptidase n=1 Tax=Pleomassaria siparia CBS 279.74 TaxID=1314801 RepID=A0A6G1KMQ3_9PLEO|nr:peptidase S10, serine carboxypeptidase [Pleomassaria siparia CBS 279.74]